MRKEINLLHLSLKVLRIENNLTIVDLEKQTGLKRSELSRFENGQQIFNKEKIKTLYSIYDLNYSTKEDKNLNLLGKFEELYLMIYYNDKKAHELFYMLHSYIDDIKTSDFYPIYCIFDYIVEIDKNYRLIMDDDKRELEHLRKLKRKIIGIEDLLPHYLLQFYYDYCGEEKRYTKKYEDAIMYYEKSLSVCTNQNLRAMILFHESMALMRINRCQSVFHMLDDAKKTFEKTLNFERVISVEFLKAILLKKQKNYDEAITIYKNCLYVIRKHGKAFDINENMVYNNLMWLNILKQDYLAVINIADIVLPLTDKNHCKKFNLYLIWSYFCLNNREKSEIYYNKCITDLTPFSTKIYDKVLEIMYLIVFDKTNERIEKNFHKNSKIIEREDFEILAFVCQMMIKYYEIQNNHEKQLEYMHFYQNAMNGVPISKKV